MASKAVAAAPEAISEESAKTQLADRPTETQAVVDTTHADGTTVGNARSVAGESQKDAEHISPASTDNISSPAVAAGPTLCPPKPETAEQSEALGSNVSGSHSLAPDTAISVTLSEPDKVNDVVVHSWAKFADLTIDEKFEQARLMDFEVRDAYLRERCRAAKMEVAHAASALDRATAIIEANLPFFLVHFEEMDAQGERSDLKGKVVGKSEWLRQNLPHISKGTFYAAYNSVKARYAEQERLMLGGEVPQLPQRRTHQTELQKEVVQALIGQGYKKKDAIPVVKAAEGNDFESLFKSALSLGLGHPTPPPDSPAPPAPSDPAPAVAPGSLVRIDHSSEEKLNDEAESLGFPPPVVEPIATVDEGKSAPAEEAEPRIAQENASTLVLNREASTTTSGTPSQTPEDALVPPTATYADWESHRIPAPEFALKYFGAACKSLQDRYHCAFQGAAFRKLLTMLKNKPDQVLGNAKDFEQLAAVLRRTAENANLLATVITTALAASPAPAAPTPAKTSEGL